MKKILTIVVIVKLLLIQTHAQNGADSILLALYDTLDSLGSFEFHCNYKFINPGVDTMPFSTHQAYFINNSDSLVGYSFVINSMGEKTMFDGIRLVRIHKENNIYDSYNIEYDSHPLVSLIASPITIKNLLMYCITNDSVNFELILNKNKDYQLEITLPYLIRDGFILEHNTDANQTQTRIEIIFDSNTLLAKKYTREYIGVLKGDILFETDFKCYRSIPFQEINSLDSIPANFSLYNAGQKEKSFLHTQAPGFKLSQLNGDSLELYSIRDKYVLLVFSSLHCAPCRIALPYLVKLKNKLDSIPLEILVIYSERTTNTTELTKYIEENKISYTILVNGYLVCAEYKILSWPTFLLLDQNKSIIDVSIGFNEEHLSKMIERINN